MRHSFRVAALTTALCLLSAPSASANIEFGNRCTGDATEPGWTALGLANGEEPPFPGSAGPWEVGWGEQAVITRWRVRVDPGLAPLAQQLVVFNYAKEGEARNIGESAVETLAEGTNEFATRIPIPEAAHLGLRGPSLTLYCDSVSRGALGVVKGDFPAGAIRPYELSFPKGVPAVAMVEPDFDVDGYGDRTQDQCLGSPAFLAPCPQVSLNGWVESRRRGAILIGVTTGMDTRVEVAGQVSWIPKPRRGAPRAESNPKRTFGLAGGTQNTIAGVPAVFRVPLPRAVIRRLHQLRPGEHLTAKMLLRRPLSEIEWLPGVVSRQLKVTLHGRKRPAQTSGSGGGREA